MDLTGEKGGTVTKPASMALMPLELPAEPYAEPLRADIDARTDEVTIYHPDYIEGVFWSSAPKWSCVKLKMRSALDTSRHLCKVWM